MSKIMDIRRLCMRDFYLLVTLCRIYVICLLQSHGVVLDHVHFGYYLDIQHNPNIIPIGSVAGVDLATCLNTCKTSTTCTYVNYHRNQHVCFQLGIKTERIPEIVWTRKPGYLYSSRTEWNQISEGIKVTGCGPPPSVYNAVSRGTMYGPEGKVQYVCTNNVSRTDQVICESTGSWSATQLICITECGPVPAIPYTQQTGDSVTVGSQIVYRCYTASAQSETSTCGIDGLWSPTNLTCVPDECLVENSIHVYGSSCYVYISKKYVWSDAKSNCETLGGYLVEISGAQEKENIATYVKTLPNYLKKADKRRLYMGLTDSAEEGQFAWLSGTVATYYNFGTGEPKGGRGENCVIFKTWDMKWYNKKCSKYVGSLCEFDLF